ncbi:MAG: pentapeptide repeat-containing protein [Alphaproteobacteria bacterium]|nr:pentapeptide repeat-containing protein [Alphaproteobacteria bacterium]
MKHHQSTREELGDYIQNHRSYRATFNMELRDYGGSFKAFTALKHGYTAPFTISFERQDLSEMDLKEIDLQGFNFENAILDGADMSNANMSATHLKRASMKNTVLVETEFSLANFECTELNGSDIRRANLRGAHCKFTSFKNTNLSGANFWGVDLSTAIWEGVTDVTDTIFKGSLNQPHGFDQLPHYNKAITTQNQIQQLVGTLVNDEYPFVMNLRMVVPKFLTGSEENRTKMQAKFPYMNFNVPMLQFFREAAAVLNKVRVFTRPSASYDNVEDMDNRCGILHIPDEIREEIAKKLVSEGGSLNRHHVERIILFARETNDTKGFKNCSDPDEARKNYFCHRLIGHAQNNAHSRQR